MNSKKLSTSKKLKKEKNSSFRDLQNQNDMMKRHKSQDVYSLALNRNKKKNEVKSKNEIKDTIEVDLNTPEKPNEISVKISDRIKGKPSNISSPNTNIMKTRSFGFFGKKENKMMSYISAGKPKKNFQIEGIKIIDDEESILELETEELCK